MEMLVADARLAEAHEADVAQVVAGRLLQHEQRVGPLHLEDELFWPDHAADRVEAALAEHVLGPGHAGTADEQQIVLGQPHQDALADDLAVRIAQHDMLRLPDVEFREAAAGDRGEELQRVRAGDLELAERRPVADVERLLPRHALVDPVRVFPRLEGLTETRVGRHATVERNFRDQRQSGLAWIAAHGFTCATPWVKISAYSATISSMVRLRGSARDPMTELHRPSSASVASLGSSEARNSRLSTPSMNSCSISA